MSAAHSATRLLAGLAIAGSAHAAPAAEWQIDLDPSKTEISFTLKATMHTVHGIAALTSGGFQIDPESGAMTGQATVDAATANTGNTKRDKKMHGKVLRSSDYPKIVLRTHRFEGALRIEGTSDVTLYGEIEIVGHPHQIVLPLQVEIDEGQFTAESEFELPYVAWGLDDPSTFVLRVAKLVVVKITARGSVHSDNL